MNEIIKKGFEEIFRMPEDKIGNIEAESNFAHLRKGFSFGVLWQRKKTDEFAIDFGQWLVSNCYSEDDMYWWLIKTNGDVKKSTKELLEIFKKEKGL